MPPARCACTQLCRDARASRAPPATACAIRGARHNPRASPACARSRVRSCVRAGRRIAARAMARRAVAAHPHVGARPRTTRVWRVTREGDPSPPHFPACGRVRACAARSRRRPASSDRARYLGAGPPRPSRPIARAPVVRGWAVKRSWLPGEAGAGKTFPLSSRAFGRQADPPYTTTAPDRGGAQPSGLCRHNNG